MSRLGLGLGITKGGLIPFNPLSLDPYLFFDSRSSMIGTLENPTLDLDPANPETLDVITATRAGVATYTDADGLIQSASPNTTRVDYVQGEQLTPTVFQNIGYTDFSQGWQTYNNGTSASDGGGYNGNPSKVIEALNAYGSYSYQVPTQDGVTYCLSFYIKRVSGSGDVRLSAYNATGTTTFDITSSITSEFTRVSAVFQGRSGGGDVRVGVQDYGSGDMEVEIAQPQVEEGTTASDFVENTSGNPKFIASAEYGARVPMILIEPSATNLIENSEDFSQDVTLSNCSLVSGFSAPDSSSNAFKLVEDNTNSLKLFRANNDTNTTASTSHSASVFIKAGERTKVRVYGYHLTNQKFSVDYDLNGNQFLGTNTSNSQVDGHSIEDYGDGWKRITVTGQKAATYSWDVGVSPLDDSGNVTYTGDGTSGVYIWGAQLEESSVATSYIPTAGSTVTRAADDLQIERDSTNLLTYNSTFESDWNFSKSAVEQSTVAAPDGSNAYRAYRSIAGNSAVTQLVNVPCSNHTYTCSGYFKSDGTHNDATLYIYTEGGAGATQTSGTSLEDGSVGYIYPPNGDFTATDFQTEEVGNGWWRIIATFTIQSATATGLNIRFYPASNSSDPVGWGQYVWGLQLETGSVATSLIPTSGAAASRTTFSDFYNQSEGTVYVELTSHDSINSFPVYFTQAAGRNSGSWVIQKDTANQINFNSWASGSNVANSLINFGSYTLGDSTRVSISYNSNSYEGSKDGSSVQTVTPSPMATTLVDRLFVGGSGTFQNTSRIKRLIYWPYHSDSL